MTTYEIPTAPDVDTVWLDPHLGQSQRWTRAGANTWQVEGGQVLNWPELLALGTVSDVHPDLPADDPLPWHMDDDGNVVDEDGELVSLDAGERVLAFVVKAVNAYGERFAGGWASDADRAIEQVRAAHDETEAENERLRDELNEVLGEVRELLAVKPWDVAAAMTKLRARLDRA